MSILKHNVDFLVDGLIIYVYIHSLVTDTNSLTRTRHSAYFSAREYARGICINDFGHVEENTLRSCSDSGKI